MEGFAIEGALWRDNTKEKEPAQYKECHSWWSRHDDGKGTVYADYI